MSKIDVIRAWKDEEYRASLTDEERASLPQNPAGLVELSDDDLSNAGGGLAYSFLGSCFAMCLTFDYYCPSAVTICISHITVCPILEQW